MYVCIYVRMYICTYVMSPLSRAEGAEQAAPPLPLPQRPVAARARRRHPARTQLYIRVTRWPAVHGHYCTTYSGSLCTSLGLLVIQVETPRGTRTRGEWAGGGRKEGEKRWK